MDRGRWTFRQTVVLTVLLLLPVIVVGWRQPFAVPLLATVYQTIGRVVQGDTH